MTTRRGEPLEEREETTTYGYMEVTMQPIPAVYDQLAPSVEDILRPLAEATVACPHDMGTPCACIDGRALDPRFDALRSLYVFHIDEIDGSLGAIVRAASACGWHIGATWHSEDCWYIDLADTTVGSHIVSGEGITPEEAAARALVAAVGDESLQHAIGDATKGGN